MNVLLKKGNLLDEEGCLEESGFSFELVKQFYKRSLLVPRDRLKEWDYHFITNSKYALGLFVADLSTNGLIWLSVYDFEKKELRTKSYKTFRPMGELCMPTISKLQDIKYERRKFNLEIIIDEYTRKIMFGAKAFSGRDDFYCVIDLVETTYGTSVTARGFESDPYTFAYNQKIGCIKAKGYFKIGDEKVVFEEADTRGMIDWMRAVFPKNGIEYTLANANGIVNGKEFGFNIASPYGNVERGTENMFFYDGRAFKLEDCNIEPAKDMYGNVLELSQWHITSLNNNVNEERIDMEDEESEIYKEVSIEFVPDSNYELEEKVIKGSLYSKRLFGHFKGYIYFNDERVEFENVFGSINMNKFKF